MTHVKTEQDTGYNFDEYCPRCDTDVSIVIDADDDRTYSVTCPNCGRKLMLCTLCHWDDWDAGLGDRCDWNPKTGCFRQRKENEDGKHQG